jgi:uncharacterized delta-60 repeat protein
MHRRDSHIATTLTSVGAERLKRQEVMRFNVATLIAMLGLMSGVAAGASSIAVGTPARPGSLDPSFGKHGIARTKIGESAVGWAVAIQHDGKIIVAGLAIKNARQVGVLARYRSDGTLDRNFGQRGRVIVNFGWVLSLAIEHDGRIVVAGGQERGDTSEIMLARFKRNGAPDPTFGTAGVVTTAFGQSANADSVAIQSDGRIVVAGAVFDEGSESRFAIARYEPNGLLDPSFGHGGTVRTWFGWDAGARALLIQPNGKIVAAGNAFCGHYCHWIALARYDPDGSLDTSFGYGGTTTGSIVASDLAQAVARQPDGRIVVAGSTNHALDAGQSLLVRYTQRGTLDGGFGSGGAVVTDIGGWSFADAVAVQPNGRIVAAGGFGEHDGVNLMLARYRPNGSPDPSFGRGGIVTTNLTSGEDVANGVALQHNGKIVAVGGADQYGKSGGGFAVLRYRGR